MVQLMHFLFFFFFFFFWGGGVGCYETLFGIYIAAATPGDRAHLLRLKGKSGCDRACRDDGFPIDPLLQQVHHAVSVRVACDWQKEGGIRTHEFRKPTDKH